MRILKANTISLLVLLCSGHAFAGDATVIWDAINDSNLAGYNVYYGNSSGSYDSVLNVGNQTTKTITGLGTGTFFFAVTAYDTLGNESGFSNEVYKTISADGTSTTGGSNAPNASNMQDGSMAGGCGMIRSTTGKPPSPAQAADMVALLAFLLIGLLQKKFLLWIISARRRLNYCQAFPFRNRLLTLPLLLICLFTASQAWGTDYYVDQNNVNAGDQNAGTANQPWKTITKANQTLVAGDTVYIKAGTYTSYVSPNKSGSSANRITYRNYGSDVVRISGTTYAIYLNGKSYITVQGITASNLSHFLYITNSANYNIIAYNSFIQQSPPDWDVSVINNSSQYNWIHHNTFGAGGDCTGGGSDDGSVLDIGVESSGTDLTHYNLIENNTFYWGGHHVVGLHNGYNTFRNNYLHNEAWSNGRGNRTLYMNGVDAVTGHNVVEGNRFAYAARPCDDFTVGNVAMSTPSNIFRYNYLYDSNAYGLGTATYSGYSNGANNRIYNNTFFNSAYNIYPTFVHGQEDSAVSFFYSINTGNVLKNNLYYHNYQLHSGFTSGNSFVNEFNGDTQGNPLFANASTTPPSDPFDSSVPDFSLQGGSPAIDVAGSLTTVAVADTSSGTSLILTDASYFQDGSYAPPGTSHGDWIAVGAVSNVVQIAAIAGNTVTLSSPITRKDNDPVWLYKKSDGAQVLVGAAPDAGAFEFSGGTATPPQAPQNLRIAP